MRLHGRAVVLLGLACSDPAGVDFGREDIEVRVTVPAATVQRGGWTTVAVTATNRSPLPRSLYVGCGTDPYVVTTVDGGRVAPPETMLCAAILYPPVRLDPGESHTFQPVAHWNLPPGSYLLRGVVWPVPRTRGGEFPPEPVASDPVAVTVTP